MQKTAKKDNRESVKLQPGTAKRLHKMQGELWDTNNEKPTFPELVDLALDAYEIVAVTSTEGQSTPGTGNNRLRANEAKYSKALAKIGLIVREVLSAQGETAANAKSQISKVKKRTPSLQKTQRMLDEIKGGAPKDSGATGKTGGIAS